MTVVRAQHARDAARPWPPGRVRLEQLGLRLQPARPESALVRHATSARAQELLGRSAARQPGRFRRIAADKAAHYQLRTTRRPLERIQSGRSRRPVAQLERCVRAVPAGPSCPRPRRRTGATRPRTGRGAARPERAVLSARMVRVTSALRGPLRPRARHRTVSSAKTTARLEVQRTKHTGRQTRAVVSPAQRTRAKQRTEAR